jgi:hypothetical protein
VDEAGFWTLIADCRGDSSDGGHLATLLRDRLRTLAGEEILSFGEHWYAASERLYTWPVWDAACLLLGWVGDDSFRDVRAWIATQGPDVLDRVAADPDSLVDLAGDSDNAFVEAFDSLVYDAYTTVTGEEPPARYGPTYPAGARTDLKDEDATRARFPRLSAWRAANTATEDAEGPPTRRPDPVHRCPVCGDALSQWAYGTTRPGEADGREFPREFRRCVACLTVAARYQDEDGWQPVEESALPDDIRFGVSRL